jgi:integrase/recombinase XerD
MKKLKDRIFFETINEFLISYLPKIQAKSNLTVLSYKTTLNLFISYLCAVYTTDIFAINTSMLTNENIVGFLEWLVIIRSNSLATLPCRVS